MLDAAIEGMNELFRRGPYALETHGTAICLTIGPVLFVVGYLGAHWVNAKAFYRAKQRHDPFPTYFTAWRTSMVETALAYLFVFGGIFFGALLIFAGIVDWIDG